MSTKISNEILTPSQCRGARGMLGWSQEELATSSQVSISTVASFERGDRTPTRPNLAALRLAFEQAGMTFVPNGGGGVGVRFRRAADSR